ncbi:MAG: DUF6508 domain-containing protein [Ilumatobacteraceae bacterium]
MRSYPPSDAELVARARALPDHHRHRLRELVADLDDLRRRMTRRTSSMLTPGPANVVWPDYSDEALELYHLLHASGVAVRADWGSWLDRLDDLDRAHQASHHVSVADAVRYVSAVLHRDRAVEGTYGTAIANGSLLRSVAVIVDARATDDHAGGT